MRNLFRLKGTPQATGSLQINMLKWSMPEEGQILEVDPKGLELLAKVAVSDLSFYLRTSHLEKLASILDDPEATDNDRFCGIYDVA